MAWIQNRRAIFISLGTNSQHTILYYKSVFNYGIHWRCNAIHWRCNGESWRWRLFAERASQLPKCSSGEIHKPVTLNKHFSLLVPIYVTNVSNISSLQNIKAQFRGTALVVSWQMSKSSLCQDPHQRPLKVIDFEIFRSYKHIYTFLNS